MSMARTDEIDRFASDWLVRRDSGAWTEETQASFDRWLNASSLHRVAFLRLELAWEDAARLKALGAGIVSDRPPAPGCWNVTPFFDAQRPAVPANDRDDAVIATLGLEDSVSESMSSTFEFTRMQGATKARFAIAAMASFALAVAIGLYFLLAPVGQLYATPIGGVESVPMPDGSQVTLNTDSQIRINLTDMERRVDLKRGEVFFEVSKDPSRPFIVSAGSKRVIAVGTKFSVRREADDIEVIVTEGKVRVEDGAAMPVHRANAPTELFLTPGSVAHAGNAGILVQRKTLPEAEERLSWRTGVLMFRDRNLSEVVAEFNRYNVRKISIADPAVKALKIEGSFRTTNVDAFVRLIEDGFPVRADEEPDRIVLVGK